MKFSKSTGIMAFATLTLSTAVLANPYPYHSGGSSYSDDDVITTSEKNTFSDDDVTTITKQRSYSDDDVTTTSKSDDDVTTITKTYSDDDVSNVTKSYSDDDVTKISKSYSDDDVTRIRNDYRSSWESNHTSNWSNTDERFSSAVKADDNTHQDSGHKASANVEGEATGHSNQNKGANMSMYFGGMGNPVSNSGVYIDNTDNNNNQFSLGGGSQSSLQAGGDVGDRVISLSGMGNTDGSANGGVVNHGANGIAQYGNTGLNNQKSVSSAATK